MTLLKEMTLIIIGLALWAYLLAIPFGVLLLLGLSVSDAALLGGCASAAIFGFIGTSASRD